MILVFASPPVKLNSFGLTWNLFVPSHTFKPNKSPKWFNCNVQHHLNCIHSLRRKYRHHPSTQLKSKLQLSELSLQKSMTSAKSSYKEQHVFNLIMSIVLPTILLYLLLSILTINMPLQIPRRLVCSLNTFILSLLTAPSFFPLSLSYLLPNHL